jgi:hypothetical protein
LSYPLRQTLKVSFGTIASFDTWNRKQGLVQQDAPGKFGLTNLTRNPGVPIRIQWWKGFGGALKVIHSELPPRNPPEIISMVLLESSPISLDDVFGKRNLQFVIRGCSSYVWWHHILTNIIPSTFHCIAIIPPDGWLNPRIFPSKTV